jgi:hypothetical protein
VPKSCLEYGALSSFQCAMPFPNRKDLPGLLNADHELSHAASLSFSRSREEQQSDAHLVTSATTPNVGDQTKRSTNRQVLISLEEESTNRNRMLLLSAKPTLSHFIPERCLWPSRDIMSAFHQNTRSMPWSASVIVLTRKVRKLYSVKSPYSA